MQCFDGVGEIGKKRDSGRLELGRGEGKEVERENDKEREERGIKSMKKESE